MSCTNCYDGCVEIQSDKCVKYTGVDIPELGIENGNSLFQVEQALINYLVPVLNGVGILPNIENSIICNLISKYLPDCSSCTGFTLNQLLNALIKASCDLQEQVDGLQEQIDSLETPYTVDCLNGVTESSSTHDVLQATIDKLCTLNTELEALSLDLSTNYVQISELDTLIQDYIDNSGQNTLIKNRMVPYSAVPYYGPITYFNASGAGTGNWDRIFLCNGLNGTPDLRGRTLVGVTDGTMLGGTMSPVVAPGLGNPTYSMGTTTGSNQITLDLTQIPNHTHTATVNLTDPGHTHTYVVESNVGSTSAGFTGTTYAPSNRTTSKNTTDITVDVTNSNSGGGLPHANIQPSIGCRYIIYIP